MLSEKQILDVLNEVNQQSPYSHFLSLGHPYSHLIDCRLNIFRDDDDRWAIAAEKLGYSDRAGEIALEIYYYGNCLINLGEYNGMITNSYTVFPIDSDSFFKTTNGFSMYSGPMYWLVRGEKVGVSDNKQDYAVHGIELKEYVPGEIRVEEAARLAILNHRDLFRANDAELYKSIPASVKKILVLDEWHHKDFIHTDTPDLTGDKLKSVYLFNKDFGGLLDIDFQRFENMMINQTLANERLNNEEWTDNRPSSYETWRQLASVIVNNDLHYYKPTLKPNIHWKNWPESGSL